MWYSVNASMPIAHVLYIYLGKLSSTSCSLMFSASFKSIIKSTTSHTQFSWSTIVTIPRFELFFFENKNVSKRKSHEFNTTRQLSTKTCIFIYFWVSKYWLVNAVIAWKVNSGLGNSRVLLYLSITGSNTAGVAFVFFFSLFFAANISPLVIGCKKNPG